MVGLSAEGPLYNLGVEFDANPFKTLSWVLVVSRMVLSLQYLVVFWWLRKFKKAHFPILCHSAILFISGIVLLGLGFAFDGPVGESALDGWYVVMAIEALAVLAVSYPHGFLNFQKTNIVERIGLLTLIILGEGIMGLGETVQKIQSADKVFTADVIGQIICGVMIVFSLFMLYFDQIETEGHKPNSLRQQIWTLMHFPLHLSILLTVEGFSQFVIWRRFCDYMNSASAVFNTIIMPNATDTSVASWSNYASQVNSSILAQWPTLSSNISSTITDISNSGGNLTEVNSDISSILGFVSQQIAAKFEVDNTDIGTDTDPDAFLKNVLSLYATVYVYFFLASGLVLIILGCQFLVGKAGKSRIEYVSMASRFVIGIGLALLATMYAPYHDKSEGAGTDRFITFFTSPWLSPTVVIAFTAGKLSLSEITYTMLTKFQSPVLTLSLS
jgi:low temperature requirement protein LtrA